MLEAVNSVLQAAPVIRASAEQVSTADSFAANPDRVQRFPQAPYISPYIHVDVALNQAVLQIRDSETGDVVRQIPSEISIQNRQRFQQQIALQQEQQAVTRQRTQTSADSTAVVASQAAAQQPQIQQVQPQQPQQTQRRAPAQPQQIAAFQSASVSGNSAASTTGGQVTLFA